MEWCRSDLLSGTSRSRRNRPPPRGYAPVLVPAYGSDSVRCLGFRRNLHRLLERQQSKEHASGPASGRRRPRLSRVWDGRVSGRCRGSRTLLNWRLSHAECQRWQGQSPDLDCPEVTSVSGMSCGQCSGADDLSSAQWLEWESAFDGGSKFCQAQSGTPQTILAGALFHELSIL